MASEMVSREDAVYLPPQNMADAISIIEQFSGLIGSLRRKKAEIEADRDALQAEVERLRAFAESIPGPEYYIPGTDVWVCKSCKSGRDDREHDADCLYTRAQAALHGEKP